MKRPDICHEYAQRRVNEMDVAELREVTPERLAKSTGATYPQCAILIDRARKARGV